MSIRFGGTVRLTILAFTIASTVASVGVCVADEREPSGREMLAQRGAGEGGDAGPTLSEILAALQGDDERKRRDAARALVGLDTIPIEHVGIIAEALQSKSPGVIKHITTVLGNMGPEATAAIPHLIEVWRRGYGTPLLTPIGRSLETFPKSVFIPAYNGFSYSTSLQSEHADVAINSNLNEGMMASDATDALLKIGPAAVTAAIGALENKNASIRLNAVGFLGAVEPTSDKIVSAILTRLEDSHEMVRAHAAMALERIVVRSDGDRAATIAPHLIAACQDKTARVRIQALRSLAKLETGGVAGTEELRASLIARLPENPTKEAVEMLGIIRPATSEAVEALENVLKMDIETTMKINAGLIKKAAIKSLGKLAPDIDAAIPVLFLALARDERYLVDESLDELVRLAPDLPSVVPRLIEALDTSNEDTRDDIDYALSRQIRAPIEEAIGVLERGGEQRKWAISYLTSRIQVDPALAPLVASTLSDEHTPLRMWAIETVAAMELDPETRVPILEEGLEDSDAEIRHVSAEYLGEMGPDAVTAVPALVKAAKDKKEDVRLAAVESLGSIGSEAAVSVLTTAVKDPHMPIRKAAVVSLGKIGPPAEAAVPALMGALEDEDTRLVQLAGQAIAKIGTNKEEAARKLMRQLREGDAGHRGNAAAVLAEYGAGSVKELAKSLKEGDAETRLYAAGALARLGKDAGGAAHELAAALNDPDKRVRRFAGRAIAEIGPAAKAVVPELEKGLFHEDLEIRSCSAKALAGVGISAKSSLPKLREALTQAPKGSQLERRILHALEMIDMVPGGNRARPDPSKPLPMLETN